MLGSRSNECVWNGARAVIKSAHLKTTSVGVLYHMTGRIDVVLGAFQGEDQSYRVMQLPIERCKSIMKAMPTRSLGPSAGRVGMIPRRTFEDEGRLISVVRIDEPSPSVG
jgi:hypothetical protein